MSDIKGPILQQVGAWVSEYISNLIKQYTDKELSGWHWGAMDMFLVYGSQPVKKLLSGDAYGFPVTGYLGPEPWNYYRTGYINSGFNPDPIHPEHVTYEIDDDLFHIWLEVKPRVGSETTWHWIQISYCIVAHRKAIFDKLEELFGSMAHINKYLGVFDINNKALHAGDRVCYSVTTTNAVFTGTIDRFTDLCMVLKDGTTLQKTQKVLKI